jgi:hypothetical protein
LLRQITAPLAAYFAWSVWPADWETTTFAGGPRTMLPPDLSRHRRNDLSRGRSASAERGNPHEIFVRFRSFGIR